MKKIIYSFIALITSICCLCSFTVSAADLLPEVIYSDTIFNEDMRNGELGTTICGDLVSNYFTEMMNDIDDIINSGGSPDNYSSNRFYNVPYHFLYDTLDQGWKIDSITMPNFHYLCGKVKLQYRSTGGETITFGVRIDLVGCSSYKYDYSPWVKFEDGSHIPVNCLVYTITHPDNSVSRYFLRRRTQLDSPFSLNFTQYDNNDYISLGSSSWGTDVFAITGDRTYVQTSFSYTPREKRLLYNTKNDITYVLPSNSGVEPPIRPINPQGLYPNWFTDQEIINGYLNYFEISDTSHYLATDFPFYVSYYSTNDTNTADWIQNTTLTAPNQKNFWYDDTFTNGQIINNNNSETIYNGSLDTIFNVELGDMDIDTLIPVIMAELQPILQLGIDGLLDALMDFFGDMPDIGLTWDSDTTNNYYEIIPDGPPEPPTTTVPNYTPWEPPEYDPLNTTPFIPATYPEFTVSTIPANIGETMSETLNTGWELADAMGIIAIAVPCALFVILWRFTGK